MTSKHTWSDVWQRVGSSQASASTKPSDLLAAGGWTSGAGGVVTDKAWLSYVDGVAARLELCAGESVFEVGCGAGAFLLALCRARDIRVSGVDVAPSLIALAKRAIPSGRFEVADAAKDPVHPSIASGIAANDVTVMNSVVAYLPSLETVDRLFNAFSVNAKRVAVLDIPNAHLRGQREAARRSLLAPGEYDRRYRSEGLQHLYIEPEWLVVLAESAGFSATVMTQDIPGFAQSKYHFNIFLRR